MAKLFCLTIILLVLASSVPCLADTSLTISATVDKTTLAADEIVQLTIKIEGVDSTYQQPEINMPPLGDIDSIEEPYIRAQIVTPSEYVGSIMKLAMDKRGTYKNTTYIDPTRADLEFEFPLSEIIFDVYVKRLILLPRPLFIAGLP